jgi:hypothetical protein
MEGVEFGKAHSAVMDGRVSWTSERGEFVRRPVFGGKGVLGSLIVGLNRGQFIDELFTAVEFADFGQVNFGEPVLHRGVLLIGDHAVSQFAFS